MIKLDICGQRARWVQFNMEGENVMGSSGVI